MEVWKVRDNLTNRSDLLDVIIVECLQIVGKRAESSLV